MKIKLLTGLGFTTPGDVVDAVISPSGKMATYYDRENQCWTVFEDQWILAPPENETQATRLPTTILDVLGGEVKKLQLDVEFK